MKLSCITTIINRAFQFVISQSEKCHIDESHALRHSIDVYHWSRQLYRAELPKHPLLEQQQSVIYASAILHDMCDKKYMEESYGLPQIQHYMSEYMNDAEIGAMSNIISTMSYSKVKRVGFPDLGNYQMAYHIVRESDLLSGYDVMRSLIYQLAHEHYNYNVSMDRVDELFQSRIFTYIDDGLFLCDTSKTLARELEIDAHKVIARIRDIHR